MLRNSFLRSINIQLDVSEPSRVAHFRPTSKSVGLVSSLVRRLEGSAVFVVAPYGSGKSIAAGYVGHLIENRPDAATMLRKVEGRLTGIDPNLGKVSRERRTSQTRGLFVPLYGYEVSAPAALKRGILEAMRRVKLGREARTIDRLRVDSARDVPKLIRVCTEKMARSGRDRIVIVWDEFGRHLQGLVSEGRPEEMDVLQVLAEVASRRSSVPISLALLLHRSLLGYATGLPSGLRKEWAKIEGRFETLQYLDDSAELYELIGSLVSENRTTGPSGSDFKSVAVKAKEAGLFPGLSVRRLNPLLSSAHPFSPTALYLLPRVAARVAQNERTIFSFLQGTSLDGPVLPGAIYEYFRGDFRTDGGAGGTQRAWLETESALGKVPVGSGDEEALKTAFLLGLGLNGERGHATYGQLSFALSANGGRKGPDVVQALIRQNLLVHRRHSDQVVVWHGTDTDLRGRLEDDKKRGASAFRLAAFLSRELPPPVWRPVEYNARRGVRRYCEAEYTTVDGLASFLDELRLSGGWEPGTDGRVLYVLPESREETARAQELASQIDDPRLLIAVAPEVKPLREAALDLWCLIGMQTDPELLGGDPLVGAELDHLTDDVRAGLQPLVDRVLRPQRNGSLWFHKGHAVELTTVTELRRFLSRTMEEVFPRTPEIHSEMVVRRTPSPVLVNARKKVELGLLERYGQEDLGIEGNFADKAIFRCVFLRTGLYRERDNTWRLVQPEEVEGEGLAAVWAEIRDYFAKPGKAKSVGILLDRLREPPFGVREGLLPLLLAAGLKAFSTAATIRCRGRFVDDVLPSVIEDMAKNPHEYVLDVVGLTDREEAYLTGLLRLFAEDEPARAREGDLLRGCMTAVLTWRHALPSGAGRSRYVSREARTFDAELTATDPGTLFTETLPRLVGAPVAQTRQLLDGVKRLKEELEGVRQVFRNEAVQALSQALDARGVYAESNGGNGRGVLAQASKWASYFPRSVAPHLPDQVTKGVLGRLRTRYRDDTALVNALATLLVGLPLQQWDDATVPNFRRQLRQTLDVIEGTAVGLGRTSGVDPELREGLTKLTTARAWTAAGQLAEILGNEGAAGELEIIVTELRNGVYPAVRSS